MSANPDLAARLLEALAREIHADRYLRDLSAAQWAILRYLAKAGRSARTASGIANYLGAETEFATRNLSALERKTLVSARSATADGVARGIDLTEAGAQLLEGDPIHRLREAISAMPESDWHELGRLAASLHSRLAER